MDKTKFLITPFVSLKYKRTNNDLQNIHIKLKIEKHEPIKTPGGIQVPRKGKQVLLH
jgi:hypothetical protein